MMLNLHQVVKSTSTNCRFQRQKIWLTHQSTAGLAPQPVVELQTSLTQQNPLWQISRTVALLNQVSQSQDDLILAYQMQVCLQQQQIQAYQILAEQNQDELIQDDQILDEQMLDESPLHYH